MSFGIIVKNYEHFNRSLPKWDCAKGKYIGSKAQYEKACRDAGLVPFEKSDYKESTPRKASYTKDAVEFLESVKSVADSKGNVKLSDNQINYMVEKGIIKDRDKISIPRGTPLEGGFYAVKEGHIRKSYK